MPSVLIVDDLLSIHEMLEAVIQPTGYSTAFATDGEKALARYKSEKYDLVLADIDMKPMDGITLLRQLKAYDPTAVVIIMTAYASTESAVQALKFGAFDYLQKPFRVDDLISTLKRALEYRRFSTERPAETASTEATAHRDVEAVLAGASALHKKLVQQIKKLSGVRTPVLLQGEAGTGKSTIAEILHSASATADAPLINVDCAQAGEDSFRTNLLGESGAGGVWLGQARGGTLMLQNLEKLPQPMQRDLVGVLRTHAQTFRLICTSSGDLERMTEEGVFDDELFYRVASLPLVLPPLRERAEDIPLMVKFFTSQATNPNFDAKLIEFTPDALATLKAYSWPGNVTELAQLVGQIAASSDVRVIGPERLPLRVKDMKGWPKLGDFLALQEKHYVEQVLRACHGDKAHAARILGVDVVRLG